MLKCSCGGIIQVYPMDLEKSKYRCTKCGHMYMVANPFPPEKMKAETNCKTNCPKIKIRMAQIKLRDDNGPTDKLSPPERFIEFRPGKFIDLKFLDSVPALGPHQLEFCDE